MSAIKLLLDSHILLWWSADDERLGLRAKNILMAADNELFLSAASWWELAIKRVLGRLRFDIDEVRQSLDLRGVRSLAVTIDHAIKAANLPAKHGDPFDHMLVAQAVTEGHKLLTRDKMLRRYGDTVLCV